jgi:hydroxymethylpyrimidine pyrophosphatase-like HAD family hydrolase
MPYAALATDYDGTIARDGLVEERTVAALGLLRDAGWRLILATGRELDDLRGLMPCLGLSSTGWWPRMARSCKPRRRAMYAYLLSLPRPPW